VAHASMAPHLAAAKHGQIANHSFHPLRDSFSRKSGRQAASSKMLAVFNCVLHRALALRRSRPERSRWL
jgi:hypothetical protein